MAEGPDAHERQVDRAIRLLRLHREPEILVLVNAWDVASARTIAATPGCTAIATASHAIAAAHGFPDGEQIPVELMLDTVGRISAAVDVPVTANLEAGYGDVSDTVSRAFAVGVVGRHSRRSDAAAPGGRRFCEGGGLDRRQHGDSLRPQRPHGCLPSARSVRSGPPAERGDRQRARLSRAGASCVFVPGLLTREEIAALVGALGPGCVSALGVPGMPGPAELAGLGVARVSYGPYPQRWALQALASTASELLPERG